MISLDSLWPLPPRELALAENEIDVWRVRLDETGRLENLYDDLSPDERLRASRFHFQRDRNHFIVARGTLRVILARYLGKHPRQIQFCYSEYGKPALAGQPVKKGLDFNLSHSHELALYAVTWKRKIGVDVERIEADFATEEIAERYFSAREVAVLRALPPHMQTEAFFNCWTRKEAYIKAIGEGLSHPLDRFDVSLAPDEPAAILNLEGNPQEAAQWSLRELAPGRGYAAALAVRGSGWKLRCWQWH